MTRSLRNTFLLLLLVVGGCDATPESDAEFAAIINVKNFLGGYLCENGCYLEAWRQDLLGDYVYVTSVSRIPPWGDRGKLENYSNREIAAFFNITYRGVLSQDPLGRIKCAPHNTFGNPFPTNLPDCR